MALDWRPFVMGGMASVIAECGTFPIDTLKTRLQVQGQKIDPMYIQKKYRGLSHGLCRICAEEGVAALYKGLSVAILRQASYGTVKIGVYQTLKRFISNGDSLGTNIVCGVSAGVISAAMANPTDVLKVRLQARNQHFINTHKLSEAFIVIYRKEGLKGLWRGVMPTTQRAAVVCGVKLPVYDVSKKNLIELGLMKDNIYCHFTASFIAGLTGSLASNPIDVVKTRLMNQINAPPPDGAAVRVIYTSSCDCLVQTVRHEGLRALWKGFTANWMRLGPWNIIFFVTYEQLKKLC